MPEQGFEERRDTGNVNDKTTLSAMKRKLDALKDAGAHAKVKEMEAAIRAAETGGRPAEFGGAPEPRTLPNPPETVAPVDEKTAEESARHSPPKNRTSGRFETAGGDKLKPQPPADSPPPVNVAHGANEPSGKGK